MKPGDRVRIHYPLGGYTIEATLIEHEPKNYLGYPQQGWWMVEQITDYEDANERPRFEALEEYIEALEEANHG